MATQQFTTEEIFDAAIEAMTRRLNELYEKVQETERWLGSDVADSPNADHSARIEAVRVARASHHGALSLFQIAQGYRSGIRVPRKKAEE